MPPRLSGPSARPYVAWSFREMSRPLRSRFRSSESQMLSACVLLKASTRTTALLTDGAVFGSPAISARDPDEIARLEKTGWLDVVGLRLAPHPAHNVVGEWKSAGRRIRIGVDDADRSNVRAIDDRLLGDLHIQFG